MGQYYRGNEGLVNKDIFFDRFEYVFVEFQSMTHTASFNSCELLKDIEMKDGTIRKAGESFVQINYDFISGEFCFIKMWVGDREQVPCTNSFILSARELFESLNW